MTADLRPKSATELLQEISVRLYKVEQRSSSPAVGGTSGGIGTDPTVNTITIGGVVVGASASPARSLNLVTAAFMEDIWIDADWLPPLDNTAANYDVEYARKVGGSYELIGNIRAGGTSVRIHALEPQTTYGVRVIAINRIGVRATPIPSSGFTDITTGIDATVPGQVTGVTATGGVQTIMVTWNEVSDRDVARGTGTYEIQLSTSSSFTSPNDKFTSGTITSFDGLVTGTTYYARVRSIDNSGNAGAWSLTASATTGQVNTVDIASSAITTSLLAAGAVDNNKLAALAVDAAKLADSAVTSTKIANLAVGTAAIQALAVGSAQIADAAITTAKINDLAVTTAKVNDLAVTNAKIANLAVDNAKIADLSADKVNAGTLSADRIAANTLDVNKLTSSTLSSKTITIGAGGNLKIGNPPTTGIFINDQGIRLYSGSSVKVALDVAGTASFEGNISASTITSSTLTSATINSGTITGATIRTASSGKRIEFSAGTIDTMLLYTGNASESTPAWLAVGVSSGALVAQLTSARTSANDYAQFNVVSVTGGNGASVNQTIVNSSGSQRASGWLEVTSNSALPQAGFQNISKFYILHNGGAGTNAETRLAGSGNYAFLYLNGGGNAATLNCNIGLGAGMHVLDGGNSSFSPIQASAFNVSSSIRTKRNVREEERDALSRIMDMRVKRYRRDMGEVLEASSVRPGMKFDKPTMPAHIQRTLDSDEIGLLAEDLFPVLPEAVNLGADGNPISINLGVLVALLIKSVQELAVLKADKE